MLYNLKGETTLRNLRYSNENRPYLSMRSNIISQNLDVITFFLDFNLEYWCIHGVSEYIRSIIEVLEYRSIIEVLEYRSIIEVSEYQSIRISNQWARVVALAASQ